MEYQKIEDQKMDDEFNVRDAFPKRDYRGGKTRTRSRTNSSKKILPYKTEKMDRDVDQKTERDINIEDFKSSTVPISGSSAKYQSLGTIPKQRMAKNPNPAMEKNNPIEIFNDEFCQQETTMTKPFKSSILPESFQGWDYSPAAIPDTPTVKVEPEIDVYQIIADTQNVDYVVIDCNVFIKNLNDIVDDIFGSQTRSRYYPNAKVYFPQIVHRELGNIKVNQKKPPFIQDAANNAIVVIRNNLQKHPKYAGQDTHDYLMCQDLPYPKLTADDEILKACLHLTENYQSRVHLLSFDKTLNNMANDFGIQISPLTDLWELKNGYDKDLCKHKVHISGEHRKDLTDFMLIFGALDPQDQNTLKQTGNEMLKKSAALKSNYHQ